MLCPLHNSVMQIRYIVGAQVHIKEELSKLKDDGEQYLQNCFFARQMGIDLVFLSTADASLGCVNLKLHSWPIGFHLSAYREQTDACQLQGFLMLVLHRRYHSNSKQHFSAKFSVELSLCKEKIGMPFHGSMDAQLICQSFDSSLPSGLVWLHGGLLLRVF